MWRKAFAFLSLIYLLTSGSLGLFWINPSRAKLVAKVIDEEREPVVAATIIVPELSAVAKTDEKGRFILDLPGGVRIHLRIVKEGYVDYVSPALKIEKGVKVPVVFVLLKEISEQITVTATATKMKLENVPVKTYLISHQEIDQIKPINLAEALTFTTGVRVETDCYNCNYTQVRLNGLEGKYTQILVDGLPVISSLASVYGLEQIPSEMIDKIEVVKGGASSIYGSNAIAGVVNLITKEPQENRTVLRLQQEAIQDKALFNLGLTSSYVSKDGKTRAFIFGSYYNRQPVDVNGDGFSDLGIIRDAAFGANFYRNFPSLNGKLKFSFTKIQEYRRGGDQLDKPPHQALLCEMAATNRVDFGLTWEQSFGTDLLKIALSHTFLRRNSYYGGGMDPNAYGNTSDPLTIALIQYSFPVGNHLFTLGANYNYEHLMDEAPAYGRTIDDRYTNYGIYLQDDLSLAEGVDLLLGSRFDRHSKVKKIIASPRASLLLKLFKGFSLRATASTGFRAPQVFDEDLHITMVGGEGFIIKNDPNLREERSFSLYLGGDYLWASREKSFLLSGGFFYTRLKNQFQLQEVEGGENSRVFLRTNGRGAKVWGAELDLGFKIAARLELDAGWTVERTKLDEPEPEFGSLEMFKTPNSYGYLKLIAFLPHDFRLLLSLNYTGSMKLPHYSGYIPEDRLETTKPYTVFSFNLSKKIKIGEETLEVYGEVYNLFNFFQEDIDRGPLRDAGYIYGPAKPRTLILGVTYSL